MKWWLVTSVFSLIQSDNSTDSIVYTSRMFQPYAESFSDHYAFVGPSVFSNILPDKEKDRPLIYISMGTVINDRPDFYSKCIDALKNLNVDVIISCGNAINLEELGALPDNIRVYPYVDQLDVLAKADAFITHCGMNSVSESLYMAAPMILYPQTSEQHAVARRVTEIGAGIMLKEDSSEGIRAAIQEILNNKAYGNAATECSADFRGCSGTVGAAEFIETAPHSSDGIDILGELNRATAKFMLLYWLVVIIAINLIGFLVSWKYVWIMGMAAGILSSPIGRAIQKRKYDGLIRNNYLMKLPK